VGRERLEDTGADAGGGGLWHGRNVSPKREAVDPGGMDTGAAFCYFARHVRRYRGAAASSVCFVLVLEILGDGSWYRFSSAITTSTKR
jgi:hypothetical protein